MSNKEPDVQLPSPASEKDFKMYKEVWGDYEVLDATFNQLYDKDGDNVQVGEEEEGFLLPPIQKAPVASTALHPQSEESDDFVLSQPALLGDFQIKEDWRCREAMTPAAGHRRQKSAFQPAEEMQEPAKQNKTKNVLAVPSLELPRPQSDQSVARAVAQKQSVVSKIIQSKIEQHKASAALLAPLSRRLAAIAQRAASQKIQVKKPLLLSEIDFTKLLVTPENVLRLCRRDLRVGVKQ